MMSKGSVGWSCPPPSSIPPVILMLVPVLGLILSMTSLEKLRLMVTPSVIFR